jgi:hypothetical protein
VFVRVFDQNSSRLEKGKHCILKLVKSNMTQDGRRAAERQRKRETYGRETFSCLSRTRPHVPAFPVVVIFIPFTLSLFKHPSSKRRNKGAPGFTFSKICHVINDTLHNSPVYPREKSILLMQAPSSAFIDSNLAAVRLPSAPSGVKSRPCSRGVTSWPLDMHSIPRPPCWSSALETGPTDLRYSATRARFT